MHRSPTHGAAHGGVSTRHPVIGARHKRPFEEDADGCCSHDKQEAEYRHAAADAALLDIADDEAHYACSSNEGENREHAEDWQPQQFPVLLQQ